MGKHLSKIILLLFLLPGMHCAIAQAPQKMSFQAVIKDNAGNAVINAAVGIKISILQGSPAGTAVYAETQNATTNSNGLISLVIGNGTAISGNMASINWSSGNYYLKTETDPTGGTNYTVTGTSQLLSVPYALNARSAIETDPKVGSSLTNFYIPKWNFATSSMKNSLIYDNGRVGIGTTNPSSLLSIGEGYLTNITAIMSVNTSNQNPLIIGDTTNMKGIIMGYDGNTIQGRSGEQFMNNTDLLLNPFDGNVGIGTNQPVAKLDVEGDIKASELKVSGGIVVDNDHLNDSDGVNILRFGSADSGEGIGSARGASNNTFGLDFYTGHSPSLSITNWGGVGIGTRIPANYLSIKGSMSVGYSYSENFSAPFSGAIIEGDVGIGKSSPSSKLDVNGKTTTTNIMITNGATNGFVLQSDPSGNGTWVNPATLPLTETDPQVASATTNKIPRWNGTALVDGVAYDNGTNVGIGTFEPQTKLHVNGKTTTTNIMITGGANNGFVLQSDPSGNGTWVNPATLPVAETDPQVASTTADKIPKWNGSALVDGVVYDNGTNVGIGTSLPVAKLDVAGDLKASEMKASGGIVVDNDHLNSGNEVNILRFGSADSGEGIGSARGGSINNFGLDFYTGHSPSLSITNWGGIGIGTRIPANSLGIKGSMSVGYSYSENFTAPLGGAIIEGNVGIGKSSPSSKLEVNGKTTTTNIMITSGATSGFLLQSDASGNGTWVNPATLPITETDPQVGSTTANKIPKWSGSTLVDGQIFDNGTNIGVGTVTPTQAKLVIEGGQNNSIGSPNGYGYLSRTTVNNVTTSTTADYSIYASNRIAASEFNAFSDERIKNIKGISNSKEDLETLSKIEITNYTLKDSVAKGTNPYKKVIAQQVAKIYPQAVSQMTSTIPDIYRQTTMANGYIALENNLKAGEVVKIIFAEGEKILAVKAATPKGFTVDSSQSGDVFVYGRQVDDFHTVDYEALTTLNISATQELLQRIEHLEKENALLKSQLTTLEEIKNQLKAELKAELLYEVQGMKQPAPSEPLLLTKN